MLDAGSSVMAEARSLRIIVSQSVVSNQRSRQRNADIEIILICANLTDGTRCNALVCNSIFHRLNQNILYLKFFTLTVSDVT